jgi:hypothetical protein
MAGVLTGGTWRSVATGGGATVTLRGVPITQIAAGTEVVLSGAGSVLQVVATPIDSTLATNNGTLRILDNRSYTAVLPTAFVNAGTLELGGGTFTSAVLTNSANGQIAGFGTITPRPANSGTIRATGGTLTMFAGIQDGSGTVQIDPGATLDLSSAVQSSGADLLIHNGAGLNLGADHFDVGVDYQNASFGVGNAFNPRANVTGSGQILADADVRQSLSGNVTGGETATAAMAFGNIHVGDSPTLNYQVHNTGADGPSLRGAIQTTAGGANLTDSRLTGAGVMPTNFGPITAGAASGNLPVTFNATSAGALSGQQIRIVNNFDNVAEQTLTITGAAYSLASPGGAGLEPINFGIVHPGDVLQQPLAITNTAASDGFSERLDAAIGNPTGSVSTNSGSFNVLAPGDTNNTSLVVGIDTATAGAKSGTAMIEFTSNGTGTSGLANTTLAPHTVNVQAQVNNFAVADVVKLGGDGVFTMTAPNQFSLNLGSIIQGQDAMAELGVMNDAVAPADDLAGSFTLAAPGFVLSGLDPFTGIAAGSTHDGLSVAIDSTAAGTFSGQITFQPQSTNARPFSMNLAPITINLLAEVRLAGDYNQDNIVDAADYVVWRDASGQPGAGLAADGNGDGLINQADYDVWRANFGQIAGVGAASRAAQTSASAASQPFSPPQLGGPTAVPEPHTFTLSVLVGLIGACHCLRRTARL